MNLGNSGPVWLALVILLPAFHAFLGVGLSGRLSWQRFLSLSSAVTFLVDVLLLAVLVIGEGPVEIRVGDWEKPFGIVLVADALSVIALLLFACVNLACVAYALSEHQNERERHAYHPLFQVLVLGAAGASVTTDLFNLYVWFEVMLVASFVLLVFGRSRRRMKAALIYVTINLTGSAFYLIAVALFYGAYGVLDLPALGEQMRLRPKPVVQGLGWALLLLFFLIKLGAFPFFSWLPTSYPRPPIAVGAFFGGILTKIAFVALLRLLGHLSPGSLPFGDALYWIGVITLFSGISAALAQKESRRLAAWLLAGEMGYLVVAMSAWTVEATAAGLYMMLHMGLSTTALFLVIGMIERATGSGEIDNPVALIRAAPAVAITFGFIAATVAGFPPGSGFVGKLVIIESVLAPLGGHAVIFVLAASFISIAVLGRMWVFCIWKGGDENRRMQSPPVQYAACWLLALLTALLVVAAGPIHALAERAAKDLLQLP